MDELDQALCLTKDKKTNNYLLISERVEELIEEKKKRNYFASLSTRLLDEFFIVPLICEQA